MIQNNNPLVKILINRKSIQFKNRIIYFKNLKKVLKPMARIAIIDYLPQHAPISGHGTSTVLIIDEMRKAGYFLQKQYDILPRQNYLIFLERQKAEPLLILPF
ncbi:MAG: hypothetical protein QNJ58_11295 [Desulfobacterales bacterium]|nr:hypothetical protein [Desulfobacterales bacterium]